MAQKLADVVPLPKLHMATHHASARQVPFHTHGESELVFVLEGEIRVDVAEFGLKGRPGMLYVLPAEVAHNQCCTGPWHTLCLLYYHASHLLDDSPRLLDIASDTQLQRWLHDLAGLHSQKVPESVCDGLLFALLTRLSDLEQQRRHTQALHPRLAAAVQYLHAHALEGVSAEMLAAAACASYSHLSALFRQRFGCGPVKYQQKLRLEQARKLLINPYLSIDEVAQKTGYEDSNYFVRLFRRAYGLPPGKWRHDQAKSRKAD